MRPSEALPKHRETIRQLVLQAGMANPRVFGSVLHGDDQEVHATADREAGATYTCSEWQP